MAERSKALRQGRNLFGGVGSNPTLVTFVSVIWKKTTPYRSKGSYLLLLPMTGWPSGLRRQTQGDILAFMIES